MSSARHRRAERNAGAFLGPDLLAPVPMRTLADDYEDRPTDPEDDRVPEPRPRLRLRSAFDSLVRRWRSGR